MQRQLRRRPTPDRGERGPGSADTDPMPPQLLAAAVSADSSFPDRLWPAPPRTGGPTRQGPWALLRSLCRGWFAAGRVRRRLRSLRDGDEAALLAVYETLTPAEFEALNAMQNWTHGRVIPAVIAGLLPSRPTLVLDLGCGSGDSTEWLAHCAPRGSLLIGYDFSSQRLASARERRYQHADGGPARVCFRRQRIDEPLRDGNGERLCAGSVDLAFSSGVVGHHLDGHAADRLAAELRRVVRPGGAVVLDAGPRLRLRALVRILREHGFERVRVRRLGPFNPRAQLVCRLPA